MFSCALTYKDKKIILHHQTNFDIILLHFVIIRYNSGNIIEFVKVPKKPKQQKTTRGAF